MQAQLHGKPSSTSIANHLKDLSLQNPSQLTKSPDNLGKGMDLDTKDLAEGSKKEEIEKDLPDADIKVILLGDSAVGKSKLVERYLMDDFNPRHNSTYALTLYRKTMNLEDADISIEGVDDSKENESKESSEKRTSVEVDLWDTAGQERFNSLHPSYYFGAHCCILVFDVTRKITYQHLSDWFSELRQYCETIPCILVANKIDVNYQVTKKTFKFASQHNLPFFFVSAADGTNVVQIFNEAVKLAVDFKKNNPDFMTEVMEFLK